MDNSDPTRRDLMASAIRAAGLFAGGGLFLAALASRAAGKTYWQIDPYKCTQCGKCATSCVLSPSASKCHHAHPVCGYCKYCTGYFDPEPPDLTTAAENQLCPTNAIGRKHIEGQYYEYSIDRDLCIGCAKCVKGCTAFGNGSLFMQIDQEVCVNCNWCQIAAACPAQAITRVPADQPYLLKDKTRTS